MECIDLGCGGGEVTFELARLVGPNGRAVGIDMDEVKLGLGRAVARERGLANVELRPGDVNEWNEPETYDVVYSRFLLQHLSRPVSLLQRMWAAVKPGGTIVVEDSDFDGLTCYPHNAGYDFFARTYPRVLASYGGDHTLGRKLYHHFLDVGIPNPDVRIVQRADVRGENKGIILSTLEATADSIVAAELASKEEVDGAIASLAAFTEDPGSLISGPRNFQVWSRRPPA